MNDTVARAKEALNLALAVAGVGCVSFIGIAWRLSSEEETLVRGRALLSVLLATGSLALGTAAALLMAPIAWESLIKNRGEISPVLVAFDVIFMLAVLLLLAAVWTLVRTLLYVKRVFRAYSD